MMVNKQNEGLGVTAMHTSFAKTKKRVPQTYSEDGFLRFGDSIMLSNKKTTGVVVMNIMDTSTGYDETYGVTTTTNISGPNARNILSIDRYEEQDGFEGNFLHFGQKIKFRNNSQFHSRKLYLHSTHASPENHAPGTRNQPV